jgi:hypothetical protein
LQQSELREHTQFAMPSSLHIGATDGAQQSPGRFPVSATPTSMCPVVPGSVVAVSSGPVVVVDVVESSVVVVDVPTVVEDPDVPFVDSVVTADEVESSSLASSPKSGLSRVHPQSRPTATTPSQRTMR